MSRNYKSVLANGEIYHVYTRSEKNEQIFFLPTDCFRFLQTAEYYLNLNPPTKFSLYKKNPDFYPLRSKNLAVTIICYTLMPNHLHFTLRQESDDGILKFMRRISNSFAHYYNIKQHAKGVVFERNYKAIHVESDEQLIHLSRYIHLNSTTSYLVEKPEDYQFSSYRTYIGLEHVRIINSSPVLAHFGGIEDYKKFVNDRINYQRELQKIKNLLVEDRGINIDAIS